MGSKRTVNPRALAWWIMRRMAGFRLLIRTSECARSRDVYAGQQSGEQAAPHRVITRLLLLILMGPRTEKMNSPVIQILHFWAFFMPIYLLTRSDKARGTSGGPMGVVPAVP